MVDEGFIFTLDDDIMFNKTDVIENCLKTFKTIGKNRTFPIIWLFGCLLFIRWFYI
jgi:hypothetical protein